MDGSENRRLDQSRVGQSHEVVVAVDQVKLRGVFERFGDVQIFGHFGIDGGILFIALVHNGMQVGAGHGISGGKQSHVPAAGNEPFRDIAGHGFPGAILPRRRSPSYRRQDGHSFLEFSC